MQYLPNGSYQVGTSAWQLALAFWQHLTYCVCVLMQLWGLLIGAPSAHFWHYYLQKWFARKADNFDTAIQKVSRACPYSNRTIAHYQWPVGTESTPAAHSCAGSSSIYHRIWQRATT